MNKPHKWAKEIKAWADGAQIQCRRNNSLISPEWVDVKYPLWDINEGNEYRIKPEPIPDIVMNSRAVLGVFGDILLCDPYKEKANMRFVFDGETRSLKSVEMLK